MPRTPPAALCALLSCAATHVATPPAHGESGMPAWTLRAVGQLTDGKLAEAVASLSRARQARAVPELDALVGLVALQGGKLAAGQRQLDSAIARGSTEPLVFYWAGRAAAARRQLGRALKRFTEAVAVGGDQPVLRMGQALVQHELGRQQQALASLRAVAASSPNLLDPTLYPTPVEGAIELLGRMLRRHPATIQLLRTQGHLLWRAGRFLAAQRKFVALRSQREGDSDALQMLARCQAALGRPRRALGLAERAVGLAPGSPQALATRGEILLSQGKAARARRDLSRAAEGFPRDARLLTRLAQACTESERPECAARFFKYALRRDATIAAAHFGHALHLQRAGKHAAASAAFDRAIALDPHRPRFFRAAAAHAQQQHDRQRAARLQAGARRARRHARRFRDLLRRTNLVVSRQLDAVEAVTSSKDACRETSCRQKIGHAPEPGRTWIRAHLALKQKQGGVMALLARVLPRLRTGTLLAASRDLVVLQHPNIQKTKINSLRTVLPLVPPGRFR